MPTPERKIYITPKFKRHETSTQHTVIRTPRKSGVRNPFAFYQNDEETSNSNTIHLNPFIKTRHQTPIQQQQQHATKPSPFFSENNSKRANAAAQSRLDSTAGHFDRCYDIFERFAKRKAELDSKCEPVLKKLENTPMAIKMKAAQLKAASAALAKMKAAAAAKPKEIPQSDRAAEGARPKACYKFTRATAAKASANVAAPRPKSHSLSGSRRPNAQREGHAYMYSRCTDNAFLRSQSQTEIKYLNFHAPRCAKHTEPCPVFQRVGKCHAYDNGTCNKVHDPEQVMLCPDFLRGDCSSKNCLLSHNVSAQGHGGQYLHKKVRSKANECGHSEVADECDKRHEFVCPNVQRNGTCNIDKCIHCKYARRWSAKLSAIKSRKEHNNYHAPKCNSDEPSQQRPSADEWAGGASNGLRHLKSTSVRVASECGRENVPRRHHKRHRRRDDTPVPI